MTSKSARILVALLLLSVAALAAPPAAAAPAPSPLASEKININTARAEELVALPGIGPSYAARIVKYREKNGPFKKIEDLLNVRGIGPKTFERIRDRLTLGKN